MTDPAAPEESVAYHVGYAAAQTMRPSDSFRLLDEQAIKSGDPNEWWRGFGNGCRVAGLYHYLVFP